MQDSCLLIRCEFLERRWIRDGLCCHPGGRTAWIKQKVRHVAVLRISGGHLQKVLAGVPHGSWLHTGYKATTHGVSLCRVLLSRFHAGDVSLLQQACHGLQAPSVSVKSIDRPLVAHHRLRLRNYHSHDVHLTLSALHPQSPKNPNRRAQEKQSRCELRCLRSRSCAGIDDLPGGAEDYDDYDYDDYGLQLRQLRHGELCTRRVLRTRGWLQSQGWKSRGLQQRHEESEPFALCWVSKALRLLLKDETPLVKHLYLSPVDY